MMQPALPNSRGRTIRTRAKTPNDPARRRYADVNHQPILLFHPESDQPSLEMPSIRRLVSLAGPMPKRRRISTPEQITRCESMTKIRRRLRETCQDFLFFKNDWKLRSF